MTSAFPASEAGTIGLPPRLERSLLFLFGALASTLLLKIAGVQYLEVIELLLVGYLIVRIARASFHIQLSSVLFKLSAHYAVLMFLIGVGAVLALDRPVYAETSGLYRLGVFSASRLLELLLDAVAMILLAEVFRRSPAKCLFTMRVYFWFGTLSAFLGSVGVAAHIKAFADGGRATGFFNEGGPLGLYLVSNLAVGWLLSKSENRRNRIVIGVALGVNALGVLTSASKAALGAIGIIILFQALLASSLRQRLAVLCTFVLALGLLLSYTNLSHALDAYRGSAENYVRLSNLFPTDYNLVGGRVAGLFLVPRMIAVHPWTGVGLANYGLVRNAYEYRGGSAWMYVADSPGLGLFGLIAEIGIPLSLYLLYVLFQPVAAVRRTTAWTPLVSLILVQPVAHLVGAQLNLTYPWITSAFALGLAGAGVKAGTIASLGRPHTVAAPAPLLNS